MVLYTIVEAVIALAAGILLAACTKKADGVVYGKLDKAGRITNILLIIVYVCLTPICMFLSMIANPRYEGFLGLLGWIVAIVMGSAPLFCGLGLGFSAALRKKGRSRLGFIVQFAGFAGIGLALVLFFVCYGNLLRPIN